MIFPESTWIRYIDYLRAVNETAARKFTAYLNTHEIGTESGKKEAINYAFALAQKYGESAAALSCEMYESVAAASGTAIQTAEPAELPTYGEVAKTVNGMIKQNQGSEAMGAAVGRLVKRTGVDTTIRNAIRDGAEWAWIPHGETCSFCLMLASNGWQKASKKALKGGHAEHIHANCDCTYAVRFDNDTRYAGYDPQKYREMYDSAGGSTWKEKLNSMRREDYAENREKIRAQKREAYERRNEFRSVKSIYQEEAKPGTGKMLIPEKRNIKNREKQNMELLHREYGGDISMVLENQNPGAHNPDYLWQGKFWEEQEPTSQTRNAIDANIREGIRQISDKPGGIVLDIGNSEMKAGEIKEIVLRRLQRSSQNDCDVILIRNGSIEDVYRYHKIKK